MPRPARDGRPPLVVGMEWAQRITLVSLEMALPAWGGHWLDQRYGTDPWLLVAGALLGFAVAASHLIAMLKSRSADESNMPKDRETNR
ncbi:MAG: AtpZ/AtpI family protein [Planctomycetales bacterium]